MKKEKILSMVLSVTLCASVFWGCGSGQKAAGEKVTLRLEMMPGFLGEQKMFEKLIGEYEKSHPGLKVDIHTNENDYDYKINQELEAGNLPDIFTVDSTSSMRFRGTGGACALDEYLKSEEMDYYNENILNQFKNDGKLYALPVTADTAALFYNKDMFDSEGLKPPTNWQELKDAASRLTKGDVAGYTAGTGSLELLPYIFQAGGRLAEGKKPAFNSAQCIKAVEFYTSLITYQNKGERQLRVSREPYKDFEDKKTAMFIGEFVHLKVFEDEIKGMNWGVVPLPKGDFEGEYYMSLGVAVSSHSQYKSEAVELAKFLAGDKVQNLVTGSYYALPAAKQLQQKFLEENPSSEPFIKMMNISNPVYIENNWDLVWSSLEQVVKRLRDTGGVNVKEALDYGENYYSIH